MLRSIPCLLNMDLSEKNIDESLRIICHHQQNVPWHCYSLDTLIGSLSGFIFSFCFLLAENYELSIDISRCKPAPNFDKRYFRQNEPEDRKHKVQHNHSSSPHYY